MNIEIVQGDITKIEVDVIVNAANSTLLGGGGVDGAIHRAGGPAILEECKKIRATHGPCETGDAVITGSGNLPAKFVVHTVGPIWHGGAHDEDALLRSCYVKSLELAEKAGAHSIAFPNISTGVYGFPKDRAARLVKELFDELASTPSPIDRVTFVTFEHEDYLLYRSLFA
jgi:O-acetyl-ADP-ribose deacetylase (regulator of RNase III)